MCHADAITSILNKTTLHLHEKGIMQWTFPWDPAETETEIKSGHAYILADNGDTAGTFFIKPVDSVSCFKTGPGSMYLYRIAILPRHQGKNLGLHVTDYARRLAQSAGKPLYLDCWADNSKLRSFYLKAGFDHLGDYPEEDYRISIFRCC